jgi:hypothetical protein
MANSGKPRLGGHKAKVGDEMRKWAGANFILTGYTLYSAPGKPGFFIVAYFVTFNCD